MCVRRARPKIARKRQTQTLKRKLERFFCTLKVKHPRFCAPKMTLAKDGIGSGKKRVRRRRSRKDKSASETSVVQHEDAANHDALPENETASVVRELRDELRAVREEMALLRNRSMRDEVAGDTQHEVRSRSPPIGLRRLLRRVVSPRRASSETPPLRRSPLLYSSLNYSPERSTLFDEREASLNSTPLHSPRFSGGTAASDFESDTSESTLSRSPRVYVGRDLRISGETSPAIRAQDVHVGDLIGHGALARVYAASALGFGVAVKVYCQPFGAESKAACNALWKKLEAIRSLNEHPHVLRIFGNRLEGEHLVSTMERMDCTLQDLIDERRVQRSSTPLSCSFANVDECCVKHAHSVCLCTAPFSPREVLGVLRQCASALAYLHSLPQPIAVRSGAVRILAVWHRDLKAENICARRSMGTLQSLLGKIGADSSKQSHNAAQSAGIDEQYTFALADWDEAHVVYDHNNNNNADCASDAWLDPSTLPRAASSSERVAYSKRRLRHSPRMRERLSLDVGTAQFMAPEMMDHLTETYDERVDIWSLGMILYQLLTLSMPYSLDQDVDLFSLSARVESGLRPEIPKRSYLSNLDELDDESSASASEKRVWRAIVRLYEQCSSKDPRMRPDAEALLQRIEVLMF